MKRTGVCPKCQGKRVIRVAQVADAADWVGSGGERLSARSASQTVPRRVLVLRTVSKGMLGGASESFAPAGETEAYACADCGFFEEYLREPQRIRWDDIDGAYWHSVPDAGGPYR